MQSLHYINIIYCSLWTTESPYLRQWNNLKVFIEEFIGVTELSKDCKILNPHVLYFDYNQKKNLLTAYARKPLQIKHKGNSLSKKCNTKKKTDDYIACEMHVFRAEYNHRFLKGFDATKGMEVLKWPDICISFDAVEEL